jgi:glycosyltransferase involved in cell wall biosynthesis
MNYCYLINLDGFGGLEIQTILRAKDALEKSNKAVVVAIEGTRVWKYASELGLNLRSLPFKDTKFFFRNSFQLARMFDEEETEICIVPKSNLLGLAIWGRKFSKAKPKIIFYQQMQSGIIKKDPYHNWIYKNIDGAIVLTERMKTMLTETTNINPSKVFVVPYGVKWQNYFNQKAKKLENRRKYDLPENSFIIGCIGRIEPKKGQDTLLEAFSLANLPDSIVVFAGSVDDHKFFKKIQNFVSERNLTDKVKFFQFTFDVPQLMSTFDSFVVPSHSETFGLVIIEAMATGLPVIATNSGGIPEIIDNKKDGILFEPKNSNELANCLKKVFNDSKFAEEISKNALEKVKIKFDYEKNVNYFFEVCEMIGNSSK